MIRRLSWMAGVVLATLAIGVGNADAITTDHCKNALLGQNFDGAVSRDNDIQNYVNQHYTANGIRVNSWQWWSSSHPSTPVVFWTLKFNLATGVSNNHSWECDAHGDGIIDPWEDFFIS